ncbi:hypothetical protein [Rhabdochromatium marinum]|uniref:hypothetical protein n=1 Tax=Rhabdochromatium marinum TaxID=48729 RepID=UPI0019077A78|nr:hypothetical protein [Rhabdochromatium marinum]MBK1649810.1 hypothetical protein [Rhabdochromatium marinum]
MVIGALSQMQQSNSLRTPDNQPELADKTGNLLPRENRGDSVDISESGRLAVEREMQNIATARENQEFVDFQGPDGKIRLGLTALGESTIDVWSGKGFEIANESILAAAEAFQNAFRSNLREHGSSTAGTAISLNRHQIVINSQVVPEWFLEEYKGTLSSMEDSKIKSAFENGETFYVSSPTAFNLEALNRYAEIEHKM